MAEEKAELRLSEPFTSTIDSLRRQRTKIAENVRETVRETSEKAIERARDMEQKATEFRRRVITGDKSKRVRDFVQEEPVIQLKDKLSFTLGVVSVVVIEYVILRSPEKFGVVLHLLGIPLLASRYYLYLHNNLQFFLIDFCYLINFACLLLTIYPSWWLYSLCFVSATGVRTGSPV